MNTHFATVAPTALVAATIDAKPAPRFVWNASESVPLGLYSVHPAKRLNVTDLVERGPPSLSSERGRLSWAGQPHASAFVRAASASATTPDTTSQAAAQLGQQLGHALRALEQPSAMAGLRLRLRLRDKDREYARER